MIVCAVDVLLFVAVTGVSMAVESVRMSYRKCLSLRVRMCVDAFFAIALRAL